MTTGPEMRAYAQGAIIIKTADGAGIMVDLGRRASVTLTPRYADDDAFGWFERAAPLFLGFNVDAETRDDGRLLYVANFDDLFGRMRADAQPAEQPSLQARLLELPR